MAATEDAVEMSLSLAEDDSKSDARASSPPGILSTWGGGHAGAATFNLSTHCK